jgi:hypothetical protein
MRFNNGLPRPDRPKLMKQRYPRTRSLRNLRFRLRRFNNRMENETSDHVTLPGTRS